MIRQEIVNVPRGDLTPYTKNARIHSEDQIAAIAQSIKELGFNAPVIARANGDILAGHGRVLAAEVLGLETVPVLFVDALTDQQARAYILADNRLQESPWDFAMLGRELEELQALGIDLTVTGFEPEEIEQFLAGVEADIAETAAAIAAAKEGEGTPEPPEEVAVRITCPAGSADALREWLGNQLPDCPAAARLA